MNSESIFNAALAITDAKKRFTFINEQPLLPALRDELLALLAAHDELGDFLENPALLNHADTLDAFDTSEIGPNGSAPKECGDYVILKEIARGGMGIVYRARHKELGRIVALKMIQSSPLSFAGSVERFETETRTIASLSHPNIVPIYDIGRHEGRPFFTMQLVAGRTLAEELQDDPLDPTEAAELARQVASAIACCHAANIIHRDLKPANILLATAFPDSSSLSRVGSLHTTYMAMVTDFGLAKATDVNDGPTLTGQIIGTPSFMPPEQARGDGEMTTSADIYSLGAVLYAMLTGRPPFHASKPVETLRQVLYCDPVPPTRLEPSIPRDLETICLKCLAKEPSRRYLSASDLGEDLARFLRNEPISAKPATRTDRSVKWVKRNPGWATAVSLAALLFLAVLLLPVAFAINQHNYSKSLLKQQQITEAALGGTSRVTAQAILAEAHERAQEHLFGHALSRLSTALEYAQSAGDKDLEEAIRLNISCYVDELNSLDGVFDVGAAPKSVRFSPDDSLIAAAVGRNVEVLDRITGRRVRQLSHTWNVHSVEFDRDGKTLLTGAGDGKARLWNVETGKLVQTLNHYTPNGPDGWPFRTGIGQADFVGSNYEMIATAGFDGYVAIWDRETGKERGRTLFHKRGVYSMGVSPDRLRIATGTLSHEIRLIDVMTQRSIHGPKLTSGLPESIAFHPNGDRVLIGMRWTERAVELDWNSGRINMSNTVPYRHHDSVFAAQYVDGGQFVLTASADFSVVLWSSRNSERRSAPMWHPDAVTTASVSHHNRLIATGCDDGKIRVWRHLPLDEIASQYFPSRWVRSADFSPDSRFATVGLGLFDGGIATLNAADGSRESEWKGVEPKSKKSEVREWTTGVQYSKSGEFVFTADSQSRTVQKRIARTGKVVKSYGEHPQEIHRMRLSPCERYIAASGVIWKTNDKFNIRIWSVKTGKPIELEIIRKQPIMGFEFSPNGDRVLVASRDGLVGWHQVADGKPIGQPLSLKTKVFALAYHAETDTVALGGTDRQIRFVSSKTWKHRAPTVACDGAILALKFCKNGKLLMSGGQDRTARMWHVPTGEQVGIKRRFDLECHCVAVSRDGTRMLAGGDDGTVIFWTTPTASTVGPQELARLVKDAAGGDPDDEHP